MRERDWRDEMESLTRARQMKAGKRTGSRASEICQRVNCVRRLLGVQVDTDHVEGEGPLKAGRKGWPVRFEPCQGSFWFWGWGVWYSERSNNWEIFIVIISGWRMSMDKGGLGSSIHWHCESVRGMVEEWVA
jgi:hypothetical protein